METKKVGRKKGTPKTGGRKKGTSNRVTLPLREFVTNVLTQNQHLIIADLKKLKPFERIQAYEKLLKYALPTLQSIEAKVDIDKLSDEQLDTLISTIKTTLK